MGAIISGVLAGIMFVCLGYVFNRINLKIKLSSIEGRITKGTVNKIDLMQIISYYSNNEKLRENGLKYVEIAEDKFPEDKETNISIFSFYLKMKDYKHGMNKINQLYELFPNDPDIIFAKGLLHLKLNEKDTANEYRNRAILIDKSYATKKFE